MYRSSAIGHEGATDTGLICVTTGQSKGLYLFFEKAIREFLDEGRINFNDVVNFIQQILYLDQCELEPTLENFELELQTGLLAQCFYKEWEIDDTDESIINQTMTVLMRTTHLLRKSLNDLD